MTLNNRDVNLYSPEVLREQDGKTVPLTSEPGGPVIGEATLKYDSETGDLNADIRIDNPELAELLRGPMPIFKQRREHG